MYFGSQLLNLRLGVEQLAGRFNLVTNPATTRLGVKIGRMFRRECGGTERTLKVYFQISLGPSSPRSREGAGRFTRETVRADVRLLISVSN